MSVQILQMIGTDEKNKSKNILMDFSFTYSCFKYVEDVFLPASFNKKNSKMIA